MKEEVEALKKSAEELTKYISMLEEIYEEREPLSGTQDVPTEAVTEDELDQVIKQTGARRETLREIKRKSAEELKE